MIQKEKIMTYSASLSEYRAGLALYKKNRVTIERIDSFWRGGRYGIRDRTGEGRLSYGCGIIWRGSDSKLDL